MEFLSAKWKYFNHLNDDNFIIYFTGHILSEHYFCNSFEELYVGLKLISYFMQLKPKLFWLC